MTTPTRRRTPRRLTSATASAKRTLLPVMRPSQNMREMIKQMIMLEDHLFQKCKRCPDCIRKHFLTIEGLAEECATLCKARNASIADDAGRTSRDIRILHHAWEQKPGECAVARTVGSKVRALRKPLMAKYARLPLDKLPTDETAQVKRILSHAARSK